MFLGPNTSHADSECDSHTKPDRAARITRCAGNSTPSTLKTSLHWLMHSQLDCRLRPLFQGGFEKIRTDERVKKSACPNIKPKYKYRDVLEEPPIECQLRGCDRACNVDPIWLPLDSHLLKINLFTMQIVLQICRRTFSKNCSSRCLRC